MKTVWKYVFPDMRCRIELPAGARILSVREQGANVCMWALVDPEAPKEPRDFAIIGTGHTITEPGITFLGTAVLYESIIVLHVFEVKIKE